MRRIILCILLSIVHFLGQAQDSSGRCNLPGFFCAAPSSLKNARLTVVNTPLKRTYYKSLNMPDYKDVHYEANYCPSGCPIPDSIPPTGCDNDPRNALYYYVYYPTNFDFTTCSLPALIMFHSGAYSECSKADQDDIDYMCRAMASRGFVVFSVSYRVGVLTDATNIPSTLPAFSTDPKNQDVSAQQILAIYRACQDARGAIRSIIKRNQTETLFKINTNYIFVGGMSAGSLIAMNAVYYQNQAMIDAVFPNVSAALGSINPDFYYAAPPSTITDPDYLPSIKGVFNMWGSMFIPTANLANPYSFFANDAYKPPIISFAGVQDQVFDIHKQSIYFSSSNFTRSKRVCNTTTFFQNFGIETNCLVTSSYTTPQFMQPTLYQYGIGSETIFHLFDDNSIFAELYLDCEMRHGLDNDDACGTCTFSTNLFEKPNATNTACIQCGYKSNFGTSANSQSLTYDYIAGRAATFFQAIITSHTSVVINKKFVEQENKRYGCNAADNPTSFVPNACDNDPHQ